MPPGDNSKSPNDIGHNRPPTRIEMLSRAFRADRASLDAVVETELHAEIVRGLFVQAPGILVIEIAVALFVAAIFWGSTPTAKLASWATLQVAASVVRWVHCRRYFERARSAEEARAWGRTFALGTLLSGALWGMGSVFLFSPASSTLLIVQVFLAIGLSAAALTAYTAHLPSFHGFVLPAVAPFGVCLLMGGAAGHLFTAMLLAVWTSVFVYLAHALHAHTADRVLLLLGNARMADTLRKARDAADDANRAKTRFLANISHELRTPLNAIIGFSEMMKGELFGPIGQSKYKQYVSDIHRSGAHLLQLINDILDVAKIEVGAQTLKESVIDLAGILRQCAQLMEPQARSARVSLAVEVSPRLPALRADETRFRQIILNLLSNAIKFTRAGGKVWIVAAIEAGGRLLIQVRDTGIGMKQEDVPRAVKAFVQLDPAPRGDPGTGLGLSLVKTLVEAHGGTLAIESEPGKGTTVSIHMPRERLAPAVLVHSDRRRVA